ncbi:hypothetical protein LINPERHAP2_LOCUS192 [Linum perenne]
MCLVWSRGVKKLRVPNDSKAVVLLLA